MRRTQLVKELLAKRRATAAASQKHAASLQAQVQKLLSTAATVTRKMYPEWDGRRVTVDGKSPDSVKRSLKAAQSTLDAARRERGITTSGEQQAAFEALRAAQAAAVRQQRNLAKCSANVDKMWKSLLQRTRLKKQLNK